MSLLKTMFLHFMSNVHNTNLVALENITHWNQTYSFEQSARRTFRPIRMENFNSAVLLKEMLCRVARAFFFQVFNQKCITYYVIKKCILAFSDSIKLMCRNTVLPPFQLYFNGCTVITLAFFSVSLFLPSPSPYTFFFLLLSHISCLVGVSSTILPMHGTHLMP